MEKSKHLIGIKGRYSLCKICNSFDDETLNEITLDILLKRKTWEDIKTHYNPLLPEGVAKLNSMNINSHRKHSDPALIAKDILDLKGKNELEGDIISELYAERFKQTIDKPKMLREVYKERLNNLHTLQEILSGLKSDYRKAKSSIIVEEKTRSGTLAKAILSVTKDIDDIHSDLQNVIIKEINSDKGIGDGHITVYNNLIIPLENQLKAFIQELIPYLLYTIFPEDIQKGREVTRHISTLIDNHIKPVLENNQALMEEARIKQVN